MRGNQRHAVEWRDGGVPVSSRFDDPFFSLEDGLAEASHVFLGGNDLPARFFDGFHIAELGFGTGLNLVAALLAWDRPGKLRFTSFEAFPLAPADAARALAAFPAARRHAGTVTALLQADEGGLSTDRIEARLIRGDARETLPAWDGKADAWFLDGFAPARNPEMWEPGLMAQVARHTARDGTFATYTAAGQVRRALGEAGFRVERRPGFGRKRHMTTGRLP